MKLDSFITSVIEAAHSIDPGSKNIRFQIDVSAEMIVTAAKITIDGKEQRPLSGVTSHDGTYGLDFSIRSAS